MFSERDTKGPVLRRGSIEVVCGSMFSGKTEELIRRMKRAKFAKQRVEIYKPAIDVRYSEEDVVSHEGKARQITGTAFVKRHHLTSASSVQKSAQALMEKQLPTHQQGVYEVYDKFMSEWLRKS